MTLENFENLVEAKIIERGKDYYRSDAVPKVEKVGEGEFNAVVLGTSVYNVYVKIADKIIVESYCDCPYDWGDVCKHEVAVYYKLRKGKFVDTAEKISEIFDNLHDEALRRFVSDLLKKDRSFRQNLLREFDEQFEEDEFEEFDEYHY